MESIQIGKVSSVNAERGTARVALNSGVVSEELPIIVPFTAGDKAYYLPKINETVVCAFVNKTNGYIIGSFYSDTRVPFETGNIAYMRFEDGTLLKYDKDNKNLEINCVGSIDIKCANNLDINAGGNVTVNGAMIYLN